jgi:hypothetical protein
MNDDVAPAATDRLADEPMIMALAIARGRVEKIDAAIERQANGGDRLGVVGRTIDARHPIAAKTHDGHHEISVAESSTVHHQPHFAPDERDLSCKKRTVNDATL